jgi:hypothetical protein
MSLSSAALLFLLFPAAAISILEDGESGVNPKTLFGGGVEMGFVPPPPPPPPVRPVEPVEVDLKARLEESTEYKTIFNLR